MNKFVVLCFISILFTTNGSINCQPIEPVYNLKNIENKTVTLFVEAFDYLHSMQSFEIRCKLEILVDQPGNKTSSESNSSLKYFKNLKDTIYGASFSIKNEYMIYFYHNNQYVEINNKTKKIMITNLKNKTDIADIVNNEYDYFILNNITLMRNGFLNALKHSNLSYSEDGEGNRLVNYSYNLPDFHYSDSIDLHFYYDIPQIFKINRYNLQFDSKINKNFTFLGLEMNIAFNQDDFEVSQYKYDIHYKNLTSKNLNNVNEIIDSIPELKKIVLKINESDFENQLNNKSGLKLLFFWGSWCGACKLAFPILDSLSFNLKSEVFNVYGVTYNEKNKLRLDKTIEYFKPNFQIILDVDLFVDNNNIKSFPTFLLLDEANTVIYKQIGFSFDLKDNIEKVISNYNKLH